MAGAPHLKPRDVDLAVIILEGWTSKLTWDLFLRQFALELEHGHVYSKVAVLKHARIKHAWSEARRRLTQEVKEAGERGQGRSIVAQLRRKLDEARDQLAAEKERNSKLIEQFKRWQYNAERHGLKRSQLDASLRRPEK